MTRRISSVGRVTVSLRRSTTAGSAWLLDVITTQNSPSSHSLGTQHSAFTTQPQTKPVVAAENQSLMKLSQVVKIINIGWPRPSGLHKCCLDNCASTPQEKHLSGFKAGLLGGFIPQR